MLSVAAAALALNSPLVARDAASSTPATSPLDRRAVLAGGLLGAFASMSPTAASAKIESVNPANNYYFVRGRARSDPISHRISHAAIPARERATHRALLSLFVRAQPMAKYRYLPRIFRAWIAIDELAPAALEVEDWEGLKIVWERCAPMMSE